jgi:hypothetical protein
MNWKNLTSNNNNDFQNMFSLDKKIKFTENEIGEIKNLINRLDKLINVCKLYRAMEQAVFFCEI